MTPNERRAIRARQLDVKMAVSLLKKKPGFAAAQHQAMSRGRALMEGLSEQEKQLATQQRHGVVLQLLDIRAEAYLPLIDDIPSQEAYMTLLSSFADQAWEDFTGYPVYITRPFSDDPYYVAIGKAVSRWTEEGYKQAAEVENSRERVLAVEPPQESPMGGLPTVFISYSWTAQSTGSGSGHSPPSLRDMESRLSWITRISSWERVRPSLWRVRSGTPSGYL